MNRIERKLLYRTSALGLLLTAAVIAADYADLLQAPERWLWDRRARWCQVFNPPPSENLVHVMIDDESLQTIGSWPWPRALLAEVIDELSLAGAKLIALDMFFPEPQKPVAETIDGATRQIDNDAIFAESIRRSGRVLLPNSVEFRTIDPPDPVFSAAVGVLERDPELGPDELRAKVIEQGLKPQDVAHGLEGSLVEPLKLAMLRRIGSELSATTKPSELRARILPKFEASGVTSDALYLFEPALDQAQAVASLRRFGKTPVPVDPPLLPADGEEAVSTTPLTTAAAASGFVDLLASQDSTVRSLPLWINYRGMAWPTMAFSLACLSMDVNPADCRIEPDRIIIPRKVGGEFAIPVRVAKSEKFGDVGTIFDIPWFGNDQWLQMYERGGSKQRHYLPIKAVWAITQLNRDIARNDVTIDDAIKALAAPYQVAPALEFLAQPPAQRTMADRAAAIAAVVAVAIDEPGAAESLKGLETADPKTLTDDDRMFLSAARLLRNAGKHSDTQAALVAERRRELREIVNDRVVVVGWSATGRLDLFPTSLHSACPGSVIQGVAFSAIVTGNTLRTLPRWIEAAITLVVGLICTAAVARLAPWKAFATALALAAVYALVNGFILYDWGNVIVGAAGPLVAAGAAWSLLTLSKFINETRERSRITRRFRSYVDPVLVDYVIEHPERIRLEGEVRELTVAFTDLAGFTSIAETLQERAVPILNEYMGLMVPIIRRHGGYVNKFLGDGIMFFYGAPKEHAHQADAAVVTVLEMNAALRPFNEELAAKSLPLVHMRAGIATGNMVVGDAGSIEGEHLASDYTVLGDRVNLAARLEAANKAFGTRVLIELRTRELIGERFLIRPIGRVKVKGKEEGVRFFEPVCPIEAATEEQKKEVADTADLVTLYESGDFAACLAAANEMEQKYGQKKLFTLYQSLAAHFSEPANRGAFTGDIVLTEK